MSASLRPSSSETVNHISTVNQQTLIYGSKIELASHVNSLDVILNNSLTFIVTT